MKLPLFAGVAALVCAVAVSAAETIPPFNMKVERFDPAFDKLVAPDAKVEKVAEGFVWSEGPTWFDGGVVFSDVPENVVYQWKEGMTRAEIYLRPSGMLNEVRGFREPGSNGLYGKGATLLVCQHGERRIARWTAKHGFAVIADRFDGRKLNSPNDLAVRKSGEIYFTDPPYGLEGINNSTLKQQPHNGVYRIANTGAVTLVSSTLTFPNGIAFSPDEKLLYVGVSDGQAPRIVAYDVKEDGTLVNERTHFDAKPLAGKDGAKGSCDGLKVDREGNVWATGPGGVLVISPAGKLLGRINTGQATGNCCWGGEDGRTLYITADMFLARVKTLTQGAGW